MVGVGVGVFVTVEVIVFVGVCVFVVVTEGVGVGVCVFVVVTVGVTVGVCVGVDDIALVGVWLGVGVGVQGGEITLQGLFVTTLFPVAPDILKPSLIQYAGEKVLLAPIWTLIRLEQQSLNETAIL